MTLGSDRLGWLSASTSFPPIYIEGSGVHFVGQKYLRPLPRSSWLRGSLRLASAASRLRPPRLLNPLFPVRLASLLLPFALVSCASIVNSDGSTTVAVDTNPSGVRFSTSLAGVYGITPAQVTLPNSHPVEFTFQNPGQRKVTRTSRPRMSWWMAGNIVFGGLIGLVVDGLNPNACVHDDLIVDLAGS